jgi:L-alanine-DL-glutamate epimerase-like enolase superfamily enzyme
MISWLADNGAEYVEQPISAECSEALPAVVRGRRIPVFLDESIQGSADIPAIAESCDGVNLKLMKTGGITEALRCVAVARALGKSLMIGCMSESSVAISAGASIGSLFDHIDLDSHLNLSPDPGSGIPMEEGRLVPTDAAGLGVTLN